MQPSVKENRPGCNALLLLNVVVDTHKELVCTYSHFLELLSTHTSGLTVVKGVYTQISALFRHAV